MDDGQGSAHAETMERMLRVMLGDYVTAPAPARVVARADALERARGLLGLGVAQWCVLLGMPPAVYADVLSGRADLRADARRRAWLCGVAADDLV